MLVVVVVAAAFTMLCSAMNLWFTVGTIVKGVKHGLEVGRLGMHCFQSETDAALVQRHYAVPTSRQFFGNYLGLLLSFWLAA